MIVRPTLRISILLCIFQGVWTQGPSQIGNLKDPEPHSGQHPFSEIILEELPNGNGIYFIERGNRSQFTHISLCALESAAKNNPYHHVYFLLDKPQTWDQEEVPGELQLYPNVHFHRIDFSQILWRSRFVHVKDVLELSRPRDYSVVVSILILYLRGGAFLHFDTVQVRPFPWYKRNIFPLLTARPMQIIPEVLMFQARNPFLEQFFQIVPNCVYSPFGRCATALTAIAIIECQLKNPKTESQTFVCPNRLDVEIMSPLDRFVISGFEVLENMSGQVTEDNPNLFALHLDIRDWISFDNPTFLRGIRHLDKIMETSCPTSHAKMLMGPK